MKRICKTIGLPPERLEQYRMLHANVWPEVEADLKAHGIENYSIFYLDGKLIAYMECSEPGDNAAGAALAQDREKLTQWQQICSALQEAAPGLPAGTWVSAEEVYHLD